MVHNDILQRKASICMNQRQQATSQTDIIKFPGKNSTEREYLAWREFKLNLPVTPRTVKLKKNGTLTDDEKHNILHQASLHNMAVFSVWSADRFTADHLKALGQQLGLQRPDNNLYADENDISELRVIDRGRRGEYIPYTNKAMGWHTDGYYNSEEKTIRAFILYCRQDAATGGTNQLLDPELAYIHIYDHNPDYIDALMQPDTLTIPATIEDGQLIRPEQKNPVFRIEPDTGMLHMRYTRRKTYIQWKEDRLTRDALALLKDLLDNDSDSILNIRLNPGEGLISNNVLHNRSAFSDSEKKKRVMFRARYHDRLPTWFMDTGQQMETPHAEPQ